MSDPPPLRPGVVYHIYNRGNNRENLFREQRNYEYFLHLYARHIEPIADTYAYCLLKNHFHILTRIRDGEGSVAQPESSQAFSNLFNAYSKSINRAYGRTGSLFEHPFGRIEVRSDGYLRWLVTYIHHNPQKHGLVDDFRDWPHSSYHALTTIVPTRLAREAVIGFFETPAGFVAAHAEYADAVEASRRTLAPDDID